MGLIRFSIFGPLMFPSTALRIKPRTPEEGGQEHKCIRALGWKVKVKGEKAKIKMQNGFGVDGWGEFGTV
jgi:hypothetical protein